MSRRWTAGYILLAAIVFGVIDYWVHEWPVTVTDTRVCEVPSWYETE